MGCVGSTLESSDGPVKHGKRLSPNSSLNKPIQNPTRPAEAQPQQASISHSLSPAPPQHANSGDMLRLSGALPLEDNPGGLTRQDSPETMRVTQRALNKPVQDDGIVTVWETDDDPSSPAAAGGNRSSRSRPGAGAWTNGHADHDGDLPGSCDESGADSGGSGASQGLPRQDSTKSRSAAILTIPVVGIHGARAATLEESLLLLDPSGHGAPLEDSLHPWKNSPPPKPRYPPPNEMVLDLSDDDDADEQGAGPGFNMQRWKRHYTWNKTKHKDLLRFLWKRFDKAGWTVYCITWKQQDALLDAYQGENVIHGLSCRLDHLMSNAQPMPPVIPGGPTGSLSDQLFGVLLTLIEKGGDCHKVVGVLLAQGTAASPLCLHGLHELNSDWVVKPADVSDPLVRTFVSNLITCQPPLPQFEVAAMREIL